MRVFGGPRSTLFLGEMARTSVLLPLLAESAAASSLVEQAKSYGAQAVAYSQANPIAAVAVALVAIGCATMLFAPSKLERDASGGTGATFNSYSKAGKMLSNKARARAFFRRALPTASRPRARAPPRACYIFVSCFLFWGSLPPGGGTGEFDHICAAGWLATGLLTMHSTRFKSSQVPTLHNPWSYTITTRPDDR